MRHLFAGKLFPPLTTIIPLVIAVNDEDEEVDDDDDDDGDCDDNGG